MLSPAGELLAAIYDHLSTAPNVVPTMDKLAAELGVTTRTVQSLLVDLRSADLVHTEKVGRRVVYHLNPRSTLHQACSALRMSQQINEAVREDDA